MTDEKRGMEGRLVGVCRGGPDVGVTWDHDRVRITYFQSLDADGFCNDADHPVGAYVFQPGDDPHWLWVDWPASHPGWETRS